VGSVNTADAAELAAIAATVTLIGAAIGAVVLRLLRRRSIAAQIVALAGILVVSVTAGAYVASRKMFISDHDLTALLVVLVSAGVVAVAIALVLGARVGKASRALVVAARHLGRDGIDGVELDRLEANVPSELADLAVELKATQARLDEARDRQQTLEGSRRELVAWVSHDLRTPLAGMRAIVEALEDGVVTDAKTVTRYLRTLREEVDNLAALVDDLFELSRTQAGALRLRFERVSLGDLVSDVLAGSAPVAAARGVSLEGRLVGPPADLEASAPEVLRVLRNLLENAIRHTPSDGSVVVEAGIDDDVPAWAYVAVHDTGGGVPEEDLDRVFDVAFQGDRARSPGRGAGAGLGLAIAKGFVEAHRGELLVHNVDGGATFTVRLPRTQEDAQ
jgi:signal transduction histidine kinase